MLKIFSVREFCDAYCWSYNDPRLDDVQSVILTDTQEEYLGLVYTAGTYATLNHLDEITPCSYDTMIIRLCGGGEDLFKHIMHRYNYDLNCYEFFTNRLTLRIIDCYAGVGVIHVIYAYDKENEYIRYWTLDSLYEHLTSMLGIEAQEF